MITGFFSPKLLVERIHLGSSPRGCHRHSEHYYLERICIIPVAFAIGSWVLRRNKLRSFQRIQNALRSRTTKPPTRPPFVRCVCVHTAIVRTLYKKCGQEGRPATFILTEAEMKDETFLEIMNSFLMTGEVPNLFPKVIYCRPIKCSTFHS